MPKGKRSLGRFDKWLETIAGHNRMMIADK
jgi:hypothetical protein